MASGWDLSSGIYDDRNVTEDELFSAILTVFSQKVKRQTPTSLLSSKPYLITYTMLMRIS